MAVYAHFNFEIKDPNVRRVEYTVYNSNSEVRTFDNNDHFCGSYNVSSDGVLPVVGKTWEIKELPGGKTLRFGPVVRLIGRPTLPMHR